MWKVDSDATARRARGVYLDACSPQTGCKALSIKTSKKGGPDYALDNTQATVTSTSCSPICRSRTSKTDGWNMECADRPGENGRDGNAALIGPKSHSIVAGGGRVASFTLLWLLEVVS